MVEEVNNFDVGEVFLHVLEDWFEVSPSFCSVMLYERRQGAKGLSKSPT